MRKKRFDYVLDKIIWSIILLLPLIMYLGQYLMYELTSVTTLPTLFDYISINFNLDSTNILYVSLMDLFGPEGVLPYFSANSSLMIYLCYFVIVEVVHIAVDVLVFIPRFAHKLMSKFGGDE